MLLTSGRSAGALHHLGSTVYCCSVSRSYLTPVTAACQASLSPRVCSNSGPLSLQCYPTITSSSTHCPLPSIFPSIRVFPNKLVLPRGGPSGKESACQCRRDEFDPWGGKIPWSRKLQSTPVFLPGNSLTEEPGGLQPMGPQSVGHG